jgi:hypothetical protein
LTRPQPARHSNRRSPPSRRSEPACQTLELVQDQNRVFRRSNEQEKTRHFLRGLAILGQHASGVAGVESSKPRLRGDGVPGFRRLNPGHPSFFHVGPIRAGSPCHRFHGLDSGQLLTVSNPSPVRPCTLFSQFRSRIPRAHCTCSAHPCRPRSDGSGSPNISRWASTRS